MLIRAKAADNLWKKQVTGFKKMRKSSTRTRHVFERNLAAGLIARLFFPQGIQVNFYPTSYHP